MFSKLFNKNKNSLIQVSPKMEAKEFQSLLKEKFAPTLRSYGFTGSGTRYKKIVKNGYCFFVTVQGSIYGGQCCINLGVQVDFIPSGTDQFVTDHKFSAYDCIISTRLAPEGKSDFWWAYGDTKERARKSIDSIIDIFSKNGLQFFEKFNNFPHPLIDISIDDYETYSDKMKNIHLAKSTITEILLSRLHIYLGDKENGIAFAKLGYEKANKIIDSEITFIKDPVTGFIHSKGGKRPEKLISLLKELMKGKFA